MASDRSNGKGISNNQNDDVGGGDYEDEGGEDVDDLNDIFLVKSRENIGNGRSLSINHYDGDDADKYYD